MKKEKNKLFNRFTSEFIQTNGANIFLVKGGVGPPLLLLHGYPQSHIMWHKVAPVLAQNFTLIIPDLRGYGDSTGPKGDSQHNNYSKRTMANDMVYVMEKLGYKEFLLVGHDRGGRVAYRLALDHPEQVKKVILLDMTPTIEKVEKINSSGAFSSYHWFFLAQPYPLPETLIANNAKFYLEYTINDWLGANGSLDKRAMQEYLRCFKKESVIHAMCEDYRAGLTTDVENDRKDREDGKKITCPVLVLWGEQGRTKTKDDPVTILKKWATDVQGHALTSGHFLVEEAPEKVAQKFVTFLR